MIVMRHGIFRFGLICVVAMCVAMGGEWGVGGVDAAVTPSLDELLGLPGGGDQHETKRDVGRNDDVTSGAVRVDPEIDLPPEQPPEQSPEQSPGQSPGYSSERLPERLPDLTLEQTADLFTRALGEMDRTAGMLLGDRDVSLVTQRKQQEVLAMLDQIIASAKQQQSSNGGDGSGSGSESLRLQDRGGKQHASGEGSADSPSVGGGGRVSAKGSGENGGQTSLGSVGGGSVGGGSIEDSGDMLESRDQWGNLPPRLREQLLQGFSERFSSVYEDLTAAYYERLAQEPAR